MRILFFAQLKDVTRCDSIAVGPGAPLSAGELWQVLLERFPDLAPHRPSVRLAKNYEYASTDAIFTDTDEVALIPPVSGG
jgi:molybdopterin converting factor small subunit